LQGLALQRGGGDLARDLAVAAIAASAATSATPAPPLAVSLGFAHRRLRLLLWPLRFLLLWCRVLLGVCGGPVRRLD
jgi:hypothetical protein